MKSNRRLSPGGADEEATRLGEGFSFNEFSMACRKYASSSSGLCGASIDTMLFEFAERMEPARANGGLPPLTYGVMFVSRGAL